MKAAIWVAMSKINLSCIFDLSELQLFFQFNPDLIYSGLASFIVPVALYAQLDKEKIKKTLDSRRTS